MKGDSVQGSDTNRKEDFNELFNAESVAIIGASTDPTKITGRPQHFLKKHGYEGEVYPVNPKYDSIRGLKCYASVIDIPDDVDASLIVVPARFIPDVLKECGEKGIRYNVIIGSGFGEIGDEGKALEQDLLDIAAEYDIRIVGPNTLGVMGFNNNFTLCFSSILDERDELVPDGEVAFVSQSGAFAGMLFLITQRMGIGTKYWASTGNEIDLDALDMLDFMLDDPDVSMAFGYIESFTDGEMFKSVATKALERETPLLVMKVGQSDRGQEAVSSHTGKMAGDYEVYRSVFKEYGVIEINEVSVLKEVMSTISVLNTFPPHDAKWGVLSPSGGAGALVADAVDREGMELAEFEEKTTDVLSEIVPEYGSVLNPVDTTANVISEYSLYEDAIVALLEDKNVDILYLQFGNSGPKMAKAYEEMITEKARETDKIIVSVFTGGKPDEELVENYRDAGIATFTDPASAVKTMKLITRFSEAMARQDEEAQIEASETTMPQIETSNLNLSNWGDAKALMDAYDIQTARGRVVNSAEEAVAFAEKIGYPVVMKASAPELEHKTEADGIRLNIGSAEEVRQAFDDLYDSVTSYDSSIELDGILVQESVDDGIEIIIGITETDLGKVMMFGLGGTLVEVLNDVTYRTLPITRTKAESLLRETTAGEVLAGHRGNEYDTEGLMELLTNISRLFVDMELSELDLNPVMVNEDGAVVVDFLAK